MRPLLAVRVRFTLEPSLSSSVLLTSAIFTSSMTCCGVVMRSRLTTFLASPYEVARLMTWSSLTASLTVPVSTNAVSAPLTLIAVSSGISSLSLALQRFRIDGDDDVLDDAAAVGALQHHVHRTGLLAQEEQFRRTEQGDLRIGDAVGGSACGAARARQPAALLLSPERHGSSGTAGRHATDDQPRNGEVQPDHPRFAQSQDGRGIDHDRTARASGRRRLSRRSCGWTAWRASARKPDTARVVASKTAAG